MQLYLPPKRIAQRDAALRKARAWLSAAKPQTTEERTIRLQGLFWTGAGVNDLAKAADALVAERRADGVWGQLPGRASDAYSTGQVLYALAVAAGRLTADPVYQAGLQYLWGRRSRTGRGGW